MQVGFSEVGHFRIKGSMLRSAVFEASEISISLQIFGETLRLQYKIGWRA